MNDSPSIAIVGAGAIGGIVGGQLARAGFDVTLIDPWIDHVNAIRQRGLRISGPLIGDVTVPVRALHIHEVEQIGDQFDVGIVAVKSWSTEWASALLSPLVRDDGAIIDFQNGINDERVAAVVGRDRALGCVITIGAGLYDPGRCIRTDTRAQGFRIGELDGGETARARALAQLIGHVGGASVTPDLIGERWAKLAVNCMANPIAGLTGYGSREVRSRDDSRRLLTRIAAEVIQVGRANGHEIGEVWGIDAQKFVDVAEGADPAQLDRELIAGAQALGEGRPSFLQDVIRKRRVEIDALNGWVVERGKEAEIPTPCNAAVAETVRRYPPGAITPNPANLAEIQALADALA